MMILPATKIVTSALAVMLAGQCARNMTQTARIARRSVSIRPFDLLNVTEDSTLSSSLSTTTPPSVFYLQSLKRKELLEIFCQSEAPEDVKTLEGEWNGCLLDNNSKIMTMISNILTHALFGKGFHRWNGKSFDPATGKGINRFTKTSRKDSQPPEIGKRHRFAFGLQPSRVQPETASIQLNYAKCSSPLSPWYTMMDEVRVVPGEPMVLIGMGCVAWGGGFLNAAPFCLWKDGGVQDSKSKLSPDRQ
jgi:hypothetical protein